MTMVVEEKKVGDDLQEGAGEKLPLANQQQSKHLVENTGAHSHHSGVLRSMLEKAVANRFSSKPIDIEKKLLQEQQEKQQQQEGQDPKMQLEALAEEENKFCNSIRDVNSADVVTSPTTSSAYSNRNQHYPSLTLPEQAYLEKLLISHDAEAIRQATVILSDQSLFPMEQTGFRSTGGAENDLESSSFARRDSKVQRLFFRMHEMGRSGGGTGKKAPANNNTTKRRLAWNERFTSCTVLESQTSMSSLLDERWRDERWRSNSILVGVSPSSTDMDNDDTILANQDDKDDYPPVSADRSTSSTTSQDISSWLMDGGKVTTGGNNDNDNDNEEEISGNDDEVADNAKLAAASFFKTSFAILGTAAEDASCHPHVLSPPLMESLLEFVPETLSDYHFWIKYSMVRDGYNLYTFLRHVRTSVRTILAIETTDGQVFGAFTSQPWRLVPGLFKQKTGTGTAETDSQNFNDTSILALSYSNEESFYGSKDTFLWKMRQSRFESQALVRSATVEQAILMESELAVYPFTGRNNCVQHCSTGDGIGLGENAAAIRLDPSLRSGSTAASETFGNPCLLDSKSETPVSFQVANLEVWTLTPHDTVKQAEQAELSSFFQTQHHQHEHTSRLDIFGVLLGGPKVKR